jgi:hypothetical protein
MKLSIFQSRNLPHVFGFTADQTAASLPSGEFGIWEPAGDATLTEAVSPIIREQIERDGYALVQGYDIRKGRG